MEGTWHVSSFRKVSYLVTTGWIFDISLCESSIIQSTKVGGMWETEQHAGDQANTVNKEPVGPQKENHKCQVKLNGKGRKRLEGTNSAGVKEAKK